VTGPLALVKVAALAVMKTARSPSSVVSLTVVRLKPLAVLPAVIVTVAGTVSLAGLLELRLTTSGVVIEPGIMTLPPPLPPSVIRLCILSERVRVSLSFTSTVVLPLVAPGALAVTVMLCWPSRRVSSTGVMRTLPRPVPARMVAEPMVFTPLTVPVVKASAGLLMVKETTVSSPGAGEMETVPSLEGGSKFSVISAGRLRLSAPVSLSVMKVFA